MQYYGITILLEHKKVYYKNMFLFTNEFYAL